MKPNVGGKDQIGRIVVGIILLIVGLAAPIGKVGQIVALVVAAIALVTAIVHFCPVNALLGVNTSKIDENKKST